MLRHHQKTKSEKLLKNNSIYKNRLFSEWTQYYKNASQYLVREDKLQYLFDADQVLLIDDVNQMMMLSKKEASQKSLMTSMMHPAFVPLVEIAQLIDIDDHIKYYRADQGERGSILEIWYDQRTHMIVEFKYSNPAVKLNMGMKVLRFEPRIELGSHFFELDTYLSTSREGVQQSGKYADYTLRSDLIAQQSQRYE